MSKKYISIYIDVDAYSFDGGDGHTSEDIESYENELQNALEDCLSETEYETLVYITIKPRVVPPVTITDISRRNHTDPVQQEIRDLIEARLGDSEFTNAAWEKAWR